MAAPGSPETARYRGTALSILSQVSDKRRIEVFRKVLNGELPNIGWHNSGSVEAWVLSVVAQQYITELGMEALEHLQSPDVKTRIAAKEAVEKLKFYMEAKASFERREKDRKLEEAGLKPR